MFITSFRNHIKTEGLTKYLQSLNKLEKLVILKLNLINNSLEDDADKAFKNFIMEKHQCLYMMLNLKILFGYNFYFLY